MRSSALHLTGIARLGAGQRARLLLAFALAAGCASVGDGGSDATESGSTDSTDTTGELPDVAEAPDDPGPAPDDPGSSPGDPGAPPPLDGGGDPPTDTGQPRVDADGPPDIVQRLLMLKDAPAKLAKAHCQRLAICLPDKVLELAGYTECEPDTTKHMTQQLLPQWLKALEQNTMVFESEELDLCLPLLGIDCDLIVPMTDLCPAAFAGQVADGGACTSHVECGVESFCASSGACPGVCTARLGQGGPCTGSAQCVSGLVCNPYQKQCRSPGVKNGACTFKGDTWPACNLGLLCVVDGEEPGVCKDMEAQQTGDVGSDCNVITGQLCVEGLYCAEGQGCTPTVGSGAACWRGFPNPCPAGEYCKTGGAVSGSCATLPEVGAHCANAKGTPSCGPGALCNETAGNCEAISNKGGPCASDAHCWSGKCAGGVCMDDFVCSN